MNFGLQIHLPLLAELSIGSTNCRGGRCNHIECGQIIVLDIWRRRIKIFQNIPFTRVVFYNKENLSWTAAAGAPIYTVSCPRQENGGVFPNMKLHSLVFGLGTRGVGCKDGFGIEGRQGEEVWIAVNDTNYRDSEGRLVIKVSWR
jgi:hypothetical protein